MRYHSGNLKESVLVFHHDEGAQDLIEYALIAALIALAAIFGMGFVANAINSAFTKIGSILESAVG